MQDFSGVWVPLVTPFAAGAVDHAGLERLVAGLAKSGIRGFVLNGSTAEAAALDEDEQRAIVDSVRRAAPQAPLVMGASGVRPAVLAARLQRWADAGFAGFLVPPPSYVRPAQQGVADFFREVADSAPAPLLLYDIPGRTGVRIETATMLALAAHPRIAGVKDCAGDPDHTQAVIDDGRLQLLAGDDARLFTTLCQGGAGAITASAHLRPELFVALHRLVAESRLAPARSLWRGLWPLTRAFFAEPNPAVIKAVLARHIGIADELRAPMTRAGSASVQAALDALGALDRLTAA